MSDANRRIADEWRAAVVGLLYPSESDEPFAVRVVPAAGLPNAESVLSRVADGRSPVERQPVDTFFEELAAADDDGRFAALRDRVMSGLADAVVFRVGCRTVGVYLIGRQDDAWVVLSTRSIET